MANEHHDHSSHDHAAHAGHDHAGQDHAKHDDAQHDHAGHDHAGHDHAGHDHSGHDHAAMPANGEKAAKAAKPPKGSHAGHDHGHGGHGHGHGGHGHHHHHASPDGNGRAFAIAIALNTVFVAVEFGYGFIANSTALMADAGHNLSDVLGLALAWGAAILARRQPSGRFTYGLRSSSILAALLNALLLMIACGAIGWEAVQRLASPEPVAGVTVSVVAAIGVLVNGFSAWLFMAGSKDDINVRGAYQHMAADAAISLGVALSGLVIMGTGWRWIDPALSIAIVLFIVASTWALLGESLRMVLAAVPDNVDIAEVSTFLCGQPQVGAIHDLHIWAMSTTETALTAHLVMPGGYPGDAAIDAIVAALKANFAIHHCTLQVEQGTTNHDCSLHA